MYRIRYTKNTRLKEAFEKNERGYKLTPNFLIINAKDHFDPDSIRIQPISFISRKILSFNLISYFLDLLVCNNVMTEPERRFSDFYEILRHFLVFQILVTDLCQIGVFIFTPFHISSPPPSFLNINPPSPSFNHRE